MVSGPDLHALINDQRWGALRDELARLHPADIAAMFMDIPESQEVQVFCAVPREASGEVFAHLSHEHQELLMRALSPQQIRAVFTEMLPEDDAKEPEHSKPCAERHA